MQASLKELVYMTVPDGCKEDPRFHGPHSEEMVCKLNKEIYGLKQSGRGSWYLKLRAWHLAHGFTQCGSDPCVLVCRYNSSMVCVGIYVDDLTITGTDQAIVDAYCDSLNKQFEIENKGEADYLLDIIIEQSDGKIKLYQSRYIDTLFNEHLGENGHAAAYATTGKLAEICDQARNTQTGDATLIRKYQSLVIGLLLFVATVTRPDIAYSTGMLARCMTCPTPQLLAQARQVLRYLKGTRTYDLTFTNKASGKTLLGSG
eukprot:6213716-Pleurochrysis_carterae.AAC.2